MAEESLDQLITQLEQQGMFVLAKTVSILKRTLDELKASQRTIEGELKEVNSKLEAIEEELVEIKEKLLGLNSKIDSISLNIGGLAESTYSRFFLEFLREEGYRVISYLRNATLDSEDIDLIVEAEKEGRRIVFLVEVKVKPSYGDVGRLLALADLYESRHGVRPVPVLVGVWIGREVKAYAEKRRVLTLKF